MAVNLISNHLVILVATYNRLPLLKLVLESIRSGTKCSHEIFVIDGGSTDGTVEYLKELSGITPVFQNELVGATRAYNQVWRQIESKYACWLSDDTVVVAGSLDLAVDILESHPEIGMVGLKMKDVKGPGSVQPYMGAISEHGILNCNHGVFHTKLLREVGYFNESYYSYMFDPDFTASIICSGNSVVMTKKVCIHHHRDIHDIEDWNSKIDRALYRVDHMKIYYEKFIFLKKTRTPIVRFVDWISRYLIYLVFFTSPPDSKRLGFDRRDWRNVIKGRFTNILDPLENKDNKYYLVQKLPRAMLLDEGNPYRHLVIACEEVS